MPDLYLHGRKLESVFELPRSASNERWKCDGEFGSGRVLATHLDGTDSELFERAADGTIAIHDFLNAHQARIRKLADGRMQIPFKVPQIEGHNTWVANRPGCTPIMPVGDLAQHLLAGLCYWVQSGTLGPTNDVTKQRLGTIFGSMLSIQAPAPLRQGCYETSHRWLSCLLL